MILFAVPGERARRDDRRADHSVLAVVRGHVSALRHIPANLLSLGALDFGMVVDGAVVMVENIVRHLGAHDPDDTRSPLEKIREAAHEVQRPVFYAIGIIITAYLPIFTLQRVEGPPVQADGVDRGVRAAGRVDVLHAAGAGAFEHSFSARAASEWHNPVMEFMTARYRRAARTGRSGWRWATRGSRAWRRSAARCIWRPTVIGSEFLPHLDEGAIWVRGTLAPSTGPTEGIRRGESGPRHAVRVSRKSPSAPARWGVPTMEPTPPASSTPNISST